MLTAYLSQVLWGSGALRHIGQSMPHLSLDGCLSKAMGHDFHPEMRHNTSTPISLAKASHMVRPDFKGTVMWNLAMPQKEKNQNYWRTAFLRPTSGSGFFRILFKDIFRAHSQCTRAYMKMKRENTFCYPIFSCSNMLYFFFFLPSFSLLLLVSHSPGE